MTLVKNYLAKKLIYDNHPTRDEHRCLNTIQAKNPCCLCQESCVYGVYDHPEPDWNRCINCGICVALCPTGCISPSRFQSDKMISLLRSEKPSITLSCQEKSEKTNLALPCLAAYPREYLALLALNRNVTILRPDCADCTYRLSMRFFEESITFLKRLFGKKTDKEILSFAETISDDNVTRYTRRDAFSHFFSKTRSTVGILLPETTTASGKLWRILLSQYIVKQSMTVSWSYPEFTEACTACNMCEKTCPEKAIYRIIDPEDPSHIHMAVFPEKCSSCGLCVSICSCEGIDPPDFKPGISDPSTPVIHTISCRLCSRCGEPMAEDSPHELCPKCLGELRSPI